jgi:hypothetical protein
MIEVHFDTETFELTQIKQVAVTHFHFPVEGLYFAVGRQILSSEGLIED